MPEIRSFAGLTQPQLEHFIGDRQLIIWGGNEASIESLASLRAHYHWKREIIVLVMQQVGFERFSENIILANPNVFLATQQLRASTHCVIVASVSFKHQIVAYLKESKLAADSDYIFHHTLFRPKLFVRLENKAVDVVATHRITGFVNKHRDALAGTCIEVAGFPDPMTFRGINDLLADLSAIGPVTISSYVPLTQLGIQHTNFSARVRLFVFAHKADFHSLFPLAAWPDLEHEVIAFLENAPASMVIEVVKIGFEKTHVTFPQRNNIIYSAHLSYPWDYSPILQYAENRTAQSRDALASCCSFDINLALGKAKQQAAKNCMCERVFPVFNADGSLAICHLYTEGMLSQSPLDFSMNEIIEIRKSNPLCEACQHSGLHRLDLRLLEDSTSAVSCASNSD